MVTAIALRAGAGRTWAGIRDHRRRDGDHYVSRIEDGHLERVLGELCIVVAKTDPDRPTPTAASPCRRGGGAAGSGAGRSWQDGDG